MSADVVPASRSILFQRGGRRIRSERRGVMQWWMVLGAQVGVLIGFLVLWQIAHEYEWGRPVIVQSPQAVGDSLAALLSSGELWPQLSSTLVAVFIALGLSVLVGVPLGLILGLMPRVRRVLAPFISALNAMPRVALAPVFIIVFGLGQSSKVALAFTIVVFIMLLNTIAGATSADHEALRLMATLDASKLQTTIKVVLPSAIPSILAGVRLGVIYSLLGVVASEIIAAEAGVGQMVSRASGVFDLATVYAILAVLMVVAAAMNFLTEWLETRLLRWRPPASQ